MKKLGQLELIEIIKNATDNFTKIISINDIKNKYSDLYWGGNGVGDRWANRCVNYTSIYSNKKLQLHSENENDKIPDELLIEFYKNCKGGKNGIQGIFVHSIRTININKHQIAEKIRIEITRNSCVICGKRETNCDHKNDLYNDPRVINVKTQTIDDFQPLCLHCNSQKRQICVEEKAKQKIYSAKNIGSYKSYEFEFPWEKKNYDVNDITCKVDTYWYDPVEFNRKLLYYSRYTIPLIAEIKKKIPVIS